LDFFNFNWDPFVQFGLAGLILGVFFVLLVFIMKQHAGVVRGIVDRMSSDQKESNNNWKTAFEAHSNRFDIRQSESNAVLRDLTKVMAETNASLSPDSIYLRRRGDYGGTT